MSDWSLIFQTIEHFKIIFQNIMYKMHILYRSEGQVYTEMLSVFSDLKPVFHCANYVDARLFILPTHSAFSTLNSGLSAHKHSSLFWNYQVLRLAWNKEDEGKKSCSIHFKKHKYFQEHILLKIEVYPSATCSTPVELSIQQTQ